MGPSERPTVTGDTESNFLFFKTNPRQHGAKGNDAMGHQRRFNDETCVKPSEFAEAASENSDSVKPIPSLDLLFSLPLPPDLPASAGVALTNATNSKHLWKGYTIPMCNDAAWVAASPYAEALNKNNISRCGKSFRKYKNKQV